MGTASAKGFACNNMAVDATGPTTARSLLAILEPTRVAAKGLPNVNSSALAQFSGYYQLNTGGSGNACIITDKNGIYVTYAIPSATD